MIEVLNDLLYQLFLNRIILFDIPNYRASMDIHRWSYFSTVEREEEHWSKRINKWHVATLSLSNTSIDHEVI